MSERALSYRHHEFGDVLQTYRAFLSQQGIISDYDSDQSVIDIMISIMAYVSQSNNITANALFSETSLETASLRKNIVIRAKEFGYTPYSIISSKAMADITVTANAVSGMPDTISIEKGTVFRGEGDTGQIPFVAIRPYTAKREGNLYKFEDVELYQGTYGSTDLFIDRNRRSQLYEIPISDIDTNYLEVYVQKSIDSQDFTEFTRATSSIHVTPESPVYFLYETINKRFALQFGDGVLGRAVPDKSIVRVVYLKSMGDAGNGVKFMNFGSSPVPNDPINKMSVQIRVTSKSAGGLQNETDSSIRRNAPKFYVSQNRGVIPSDYEDILRAKLPYINSISVWSGQEGKGYLDQLGRIYISANTDKSQKLTEAQKQEIYAMVRDEFGTGGIIPIIIDVDNIFIDLNVKVLVDDFVFLKSSKIAELVRTYADKFNDEHLERFSGIYEHSVFTAGIDKLDETISSNLTSVKIQKRILPDTRRRSTYEFSYMNPVIDVVSNSFTYETKIVFIKSKPDGTLNIYEIIDGDEILVRPGVGSVNFETGEVTVSDIIISRVNQLTKDVRFSATPVRNNIYSDKNNVVAINEVNVTVDRL